LEIVSKRRSGDGLVLLWSLDRLEIALDRIWVAAAARVPLISGIAIVTAKVTMTNLSISNLVFSEGLYFATKYYY
jgi:hypothetical protein